MKKLLSLFVFLILFAAYFINPSLTKAQVFTSNCQSADSGRYGECRNLGNCKDDESEETPWPGGVASQSCTAEGAVCCVKRNSGEATNKFDPEPCTPSIGSGEGFPSAIGCIPYQRPLATMEFFLKWGVPTAGGIAFLLLLFGAFTIMTSTGNPEKVKMGQEIVTSAISGLILLIFSIFILRVIGVDILQIPGLT